jgi:lipopolysaccharide transport system ATP-binding protein
MSDTIIKVDNLSKRYLLKHQQSERYIALRDVMANAIKNLGRKISSSTASNLKPQGREEEFYALKDVSLEVKRGDRVGIIGRNGAGKTTLLKLLSRITEPTNGRIEIKGRVASLLEVGTGFHPELTGRENIFLNGAILGMKKGEIKLKFDEIVDFAEIEKFLDTPVKRYSSGMYVRLAFAVAAHLEPEILIVDEVLAVGDAQFQKKCLGKMEEVGKGGRTVLFVSHNMNAILTLCKRCLILNNGRLVADQPPYKAIQMYLGGSVCSSSFVRPRRLNGKPTFVSGRLRMIDDEVNTKIHIDLEIESDEERRVSLDLRLIDDIGRPVGYGSLGAFNENELLKIGKGVTSIMLDFPTGQLADGTYYICIDLTQPDVEYYDRVDNYLSFEISRTPVEGARRTLSQSWGYGCYEIPLKLHS